MQAQYETNLIYRKLDQNGDTVFGCSMNDFLSGQDAMAQVIMTRLRACQDEWWEGDHSALPYFTEILGGPGGDDRRQRIDLMVIARLLDTVCVLGVDDFTSSLSGRNYQCKCTVRTVYGPVPAEVTI